MNAIKKYKAFFADASGNYIIEPRVIYDADYNSALDRANNIAKESGNKEIVKINIVPLGTSKTVCNNRFF